MMRMILASVFALLLMGFQSSVFAQDPVIETEFSEDPVTVGQPFILRVTVLVPTFMPKPPVFPSFEVENMIVRLPEKSTSPTSKKIEGETWSGITRSYRLYPMLAGETQIPAQSVTLFYMSPETNQEVTFTGNTPELTLKATLPDGAQDLDPPLLAQGLSVTQTLTPQAGPLAVGESIERKIIAKIEGTSPLFIPPFLGSETLAGVTIYPQDPKVTESSNRGVMSGTREERVVYIAQTAGTTVLPDLSLSWFNLETNSVETITLPGLTVEITQPNALEQSLDQNLILTLVGFALLALLVWFVWRRFARSHLEKIRFRLVSNYNTTAYAIHKQAQKAAEDRDLSRLLAILENLAPKATSSDAAIRNLTHALYGMSPVPKAGLDPLWAEVQRQLKATQPRLSLGAVLGLEPPKKHGLGSDFGNQGS